MKRNVVSVTAVCLALCIVLSGCAGVNFIGYFQQLGALLGGRNLTPFAQMEYARPDMDAFSRTLEDCCGRAEKETAYRIWWALFMNAMLRLMIFTAIWRWR